MQAWFPTGKPICGHGSCVPDLAPHWLFRVGAGLHFPHVEWFPIFLFLHSVLVECFFLLVQTVDLSPGFPPITVGSMYIFLYFTFHNLHFFLYFVTIFNPSVSIMITSVLNCALIGWLSLHHFVVFFLELWSVLSFGPFFCPEYLTFNIELNTQG